MRRPTVFFGVELDGKGVVAPDAGGECVDVFGLSCSGEASSGTG